MASETNDFIFKITFVKGRGDPRRVFDAASLLIEGFEQLDDAMATAIDAQLATRTVLEDVLPGSLKVIIRTILNDVDDQALKDGEYKKAIGPALVRGKHLVLKALDNDKEDAASSVILLRADLQKEIASTDVKHLPAYGEVHDAQLVGALDKIQDAKRTVDPKDRLTIETETGKTYEVDLSKNWSAAELVPIQNITEKTSEATVILTIKRPDLLGDAKWQFTHGNANLFATIHDDKWLAKFKSGKTPIHSGDALRCKVRFTYLFDDKHKMIELKTDILKVLSILKGAGHQTSMFESSSSYLHPAQSDHLPACYIVDMAQLIKQSNIACRAGQRVVPTIPALHRVFE